MPKKAGGKGTDAHQEANEPPSDLVRNCPVGWGWEFQENSVFRRADTPSDEVQQFDELEFANFLPVRDLTELLAYLEDFHDQMLRCNSRIQMERTHGRADLQTLAGWEANLLSEIKRELRNAQTVLFQWIPDPKSRPSFDADPSTFHEAKTQLQYLIDSLVNSDDSEVEVLENTSESQPVEHLIDDSGWPTLVEVAIRLRSDPKAKSSITSNLIRNGELLDNGKKGSARRVDPISLLKYIEREGVTYTNPEVDEN